MPHWEPKVERRQHPFGEAGVNNSLMEVAKKAAEGSLDPRVRAWAIECLERARREKGLKVKTESERARILLEAVQKKLWVPDPVGSEWMAGAHLTACVDKDAPCFHGGDCDDQVVLLAACFLTVGLHTMIVGHGYNSKGHIQHVLCAVRVAGRWMYADPSTDLPLGECVAFTREQLLSTPNVKVICDQKKCLTFPTLFDPDKHGFVEKGEFVGVNGPGGEPILIWIEGPGEVMQWLGQEQDDASDIGESAYVAAWAKIKEEGFGTSKEDFQAYAAVAGGTAAGAGCVAAGSVTAGATTALAPFCAEVGAIITSWATGFVYDVASALFGGQDPCSDGRAKCTATNELPGYVYNAQVALQNRWDTAVTAILKARHGTPSWGGYTADQVRWAEDRLRGKLVGQFYGLAGPWPSSTTLDQMAGYVRQLEDALARSTKTLTGALALVLVEVKAAQKPPPPLRSASPSPSTATTTKKSSTGKVLVGTAILSAIGYGALRFFA